MKRITTEEVIKAYETTGLKPAQKSYYPTKECACGLGVIAQLNGWKDVADISGEIDKVYGLAYRIGFANGFDGNELITRGEIEMQGWNDGRSAWEAVKHLVVDSSIDTTEQHSSEATEAV